MNNRVMRNCEILANNTLTASKAFAWDYNYSHVAFAASYPDREAELERVRTAKKIISSENSLFSNLAQSSTRTVVAARILKVPDPVAEMNRIKAVYKLLKTRFFSSEYTAVAAVLICDSGKDPVYLTEKMRRIYDTLNSRHFLLTSYESLAVIALMAISDKSVEELAGESEAIYRGIKGDFFSKGDAYAISNLLALYSEPVNVKCEAALRVRDELKRAGIRFGSYGTAAVIAPLAIISLKYDDNMLVGQIIQAEQYLSTKKVLGGILGVGKNIRSMLAVSAVTRAFSDDENVSSVGATASAVVAAIAEEIAILACICACTAASASAASSS